MALNPPLDANGNVKTSTTVNLTTGGAVVPGTAAAQSNLAGVQFNTAAPAPTNGQQMAMQGDSAGNLYVNAEGRKATYRAYVSGPTPATGIMTGFYPNGTKIIRITKILIWGTQTTAAIVGVELEKCSTLDTGGTQIGRAHV